MSWKEKVRAMQVGHQTAGIDPDERIPDEWEAVDQITQSDISRQVHDRGEPPPRILTPFQQTVIPVYAQPSDLFTTATYALTGGNVATRICPAQSEGIGCQVTLLNYGDGAGSGHILIAPTSEALRPSTAGGFQMQSIRLDPPAASGQAVPFLLNTRISLWAICNDAVTANIGVIIENYLPDSHTWEPWQVGRQ
jgi:hypothetical protein